MINVLCKTKWLVKHCLCYVGKMIVPIGNSSYQHGARVYLNFTLHYTGEHIDEVLQKWCKMSYDIQYSNYESEDIVRKWLSHCETPSNRKLIYCKLFQGLATGESSTENKRIYFNYGDMHATDILLFHVCDTEVEHWTYEELMDLVRAFEKYCYEHIHKDNLFLCSIAVYDSSFLQK